jgi:hypothetical protein
MKGSNTPSLSLVAAGLLAGAAWLGAACNQSEAAQAPAREKVAPAAAAQVAAGPRVDNPNYTISFRADGPYQQGQEGTAEVTVESKGEYHINNEYPFRFTPKEGEGVTFKGPVGREGGTVEKMKVTLKVPFTPTKGGEVKLAGKMSLSVCSDKQCLMEKQDLEVLAKVKLSAAGGRRALGAPGAKRVACRREGLERARPLGEP